LTRSSSSAGLCWLLGLVAVLAISCAKPEVKQEPPPTPKAVDIQIPELTIPDPKLPAPTGLKKGDLPPVGSYLLPEKVVEVKPHDMPRDNPGVARYDIEADIDDVMDFYRKRGYKVVRNPKGASVFPRSGDGILQILRGKGRKVRILAITETTNPDTTVDPLDFQNLD
jgi:hypothetical protein